MDPLPNPDVLVRRPRGGPRVFNLLTVRAEDWRAAHLDLELFERSILVPKGQGEATANQMRKDGLIVFGAYGRGEYDRKEAPRA